MMANLLFLLAVALSPSDAYNQGNKLYAKREYAQAVLAYEQALAAAPGARVQYNLANALFKSGSVGKAIVHYRRARYLDPRDADIASNLAFARNYRADKVLVAPSPFARALEAAFHRLSHRESTVAAAVACLLAALCLSAWIVRRGAAPLVGAIAFGAIALFCLVTRQAWAGEIDSHPAVVVVPEAGAWSGPGEDMKQIMLLHDGTELRIRERRGDYLLAQLPGGAGGWIRRDAVESIY